jgi:peroxiredoxin
MSIPLGSPAPDFELPGVDGKTHSLEGYAYAKVLVLVQFCNHCPYVLSWEDRLAGIATDYAGRGVRIVAVSSNDAEAYPEDSFERMQERAEKKRFPFAYVYDETQELARALEAERTPEVFVFDQERILRYHGSIDDSRDQRSVRTQYLRDALGALLVSKAPPVPESEPVGCSVKYRSGSV